MSKKSRRRNKKILAAIGIGLGAAALASKRRKDATADVDSGRSGDSASADARTNANKKTDYITKKDTSKSDVVAATPKKVSVPVGKMRGAGTDESAIAGQKTRADYAKNSRINALNTSEGSPSIDNPYKIKANPQKRGTFKSGGKVKGCGKALRGFGRAMKKGKR